jgi:hypothetical protein
MKLPKFLPKVIFALNAISAMSAFSMTVVEVAVDSNAKSREDVWPLVTQSLMTAEKGDVVTIVDVENGLRVATFKVTEEMGSSPNPNARTTWLLKQQGTGIANAKKFLMDRNTGLRDPSDFVRWVRSLELRKTEFPSANRIEAVYFGSPLVSSPEAYSMKNRYPSDDFLFSKDNGLYSTVGKESSLKNVDVHVVHSPGLSEFSERNRDFHQAKIKRFYGLFVQNLGGNLASFSGTSDHLKNVAKVNFQKVNYGAVENSGGKPIVWEVLSPQLERQDTNRQKSLWDATIQRNTIAPIRQVAPIDIGITWNKNVDVDIYVMSPGDKELSYKKTVSEKNDGRFLKDIVSLPGTNGFETVVYDRDVPFRQLRVYINHYSGISREPIDGELRIRIDGVTYAKKFRLPAGQGTGGGGNRDNDPAWLKMDIPQILGITS